MLLHLKPVSGMALDLASMQAQLLQSGLRIGFSPTSEAPGLRETGWFGSHVAVVVKWPGSILVCSTGINLQPAEAKPWTWDSSPWCSGWLD